MTRGNPNSGRRGDEKAVDWLKPNWGTRHACGNLVRHHIIHLLAAQHIKDDWDDEG